jgi:putative zinc finger protein
MNHPYELLADFIDGTLDEGDLAGVRAHLDVCASCREDVAHATAGREAARSLPQATAPTDLHQRIVAAAGGLDHGTPAWYRWAGVAAAAAVIVVIAIALPNVGGNGDRPGSVERATAAVDSAGSQQAGAFSAGDVPTTVQNKDYSQEDLQRLASASRSEALSSAQEDAPTSEIADPAAAVRCVARATQRGATGRLTRLIEARFEGRHAYIAVYLEGPGADQRPDLVALWVAARDNCSLLSLAFSQI